VRSHRADTLLGMSTGIRVLVAAGIAAVIAAALAAGQVALAELAGITTLDAEFAAGEERTEGVQVTLLVWYAAVSVAIAVTVAARPITHRPTAVHFAALLAAALAALAGAPVAAAFSGRPLADQVWPATIAGVVLGAVMALVVLAIPAAGSGITAHAVLLWVAALGFTLVPSDAWVVTYAGLVEPLGLGLLEPLDSVAFLGYHLPWMLPTAVAVVVLSIVVARRAMRQTASRLTAVAAGVAGPLLAALSYWVQPDALSLWNEYAARIALLLAFCCLVASAAVAALKSRRRLLRKRLRADAG
jgi:hypothetical protein